MHCVFEKAAPAAINRQLCAMPVRKCFLVKLTSCCVTMELTQQQSIKAALKLHLKPIHSLEVYFSIDIHLHKYISIIKITINSAVGDQILILRYFLTSIGL